MGRIDHVAEHNRNSPAFTRRRVPGGKKAAIRRGRITISAGGQGPRFRRGVAVWIQSAAATTAKAIVRFIDKSTVGARAQRQRMSAGRAELASTLVVRPALETPHCFYVLRYGNPALSISHFKQLTCSPYDSTTVSQPKLGK